MENLTANENLNHPNVSIIRELTDDDLRKILFLVIDSKELNSYEFLTEQSERMKKKLEQIYAQCDSSLVLETLTAIKKYAYLKRFNTCKHQRESPTQGYIENFRKFLFSICEEMTDDDVSYVGKELKFGENQFVSAECLMCRLLVEKVITSENVTNLRRVFEKNPSMYDDILKKFHEFCESVQSASSSDETSFSEEDSEEEVMVYPVRFSAKDKTCGVAVIVNQVKFRRFKRRNGSDVDRDKLMAVWKKFGFRVLLKENLKAAEIQTLFENLAQKQYERPSIFVACVLSHGNQGDIIYGSDDKSVNVHGLVHTIANNCRSLYEMPKLFFIQACKGENVQEGLVLDSPNSNSNDVDEYDFDAQRYIPRMCDTFVAYATVEGYASLRSEGRGSIFIQELTKYLEKFGEKEDIDVIMKRVTNSIAAMEPRVKQEVHPRALAATKLPKQMPECRSTLRGILKLRKQ